MSGIKLTSSTPDMERWKAEKTLKKAKKQAIKQLKSEGSSHGLAKKLVEAAINRIARGESDVTED